MSPCNLRLQFRHAPLPCRHSMAVITNNHTVMPTASCLAWRETRRVIVLAMIKCCSSHQRLATSETLAPSCCVHMPWRSGSEWQGFLLSQVLHIGISTGEDGGADIQQSMGRTCLIAVRALQAGVVKWLRQRQP